MKNIKGITIISLVITIIVLLILAGISIQMLSGDNGIINRTQEAKKQMEDNQDFEILKLKVIESSINEGKPDIEALIPKLHDMGCTILGSSFPLTVSYNGKEYKIEEDGTIKANNGKTDENWDEDKGVNKPKLASGLIPVTFNNDGSVTELSSNDYTNWYDYSNKKWANAITKDKNGKITGYWVWIPRYEYKVNSAGQNFTVKFIPVTQTIEDNGYDHIHPAFRDGSKTHYMNGEWDSELPGIWVAKFPAGFQQNTITDSNGTLSEDISNSEDTLVLSNKNYTSVDGDSINMALGTITVDSKMSLPVFNPLTYAYNMISTGDIYTLAQEVSKSTDFYGLSSNTNSHMLKNSEWGAITYLAQSQYGRNGTEVNINNNATYYREAPYKDAITGIYAEGADDWIANSLGNPWYTAEGQLGSSTGNITGIYDLNGCVCERIACYISNGSDYLEFYAGISNWAKTTANENGYLTESSKYYTVYPYDASSDTWQDNWNKYTSLKSSTYGYGDAMIEITTEIEDDHYNTWMYTSSGYMYMNFPFLERGGNFVIGSFSGSFQYGEDMGIGGESSGFRVALCP